MNKFWGFIIDFVILFLFWGLVNYGSGNQFLITGWNFWGVMVLLVLYRYSGIEQSHWR